MEGHGRDVVLVYGRPVLHGRAVIWVVEVHPDTSVPAGRQDLVRQPDDGGDVLTSDHRQLPHQTAVVEVPHAQDALSTAGYLRG